MINIYHSEYIVLTFKIIHELSYRHFTISKIHEIAYEVFRDDLLGVNVFDEHNIILTVNRTYTDEYDCEPGRDLTTEFKTRLEEYLKGL